MATINRLLMKVFPDTSNSYWGFIFVILIPTLFRDVSTDKVLLPNNEFPATVIVFPIFTSFEYIVFMIFTNAPLMVELPFTTKLPFRFVFPDTYNLLLIDTSLITNKFLLMITLLVTFTIPDISKSYCGFELLIPTLLPPL